MNTPEQSPTGGAASDAPAPAPVFYRSVREFLGSLPGVSQRFWVLVVATGVISGLGSVVLLDLLAFVRELCWGASPTVIDGFRAASPARRVLVPALGGLLVTLVMLGTRKRLGGHGTAGIIEAIWVQQGRLQLGRALLRGVLSIFAVAMGASLGREGALLQTGAASGSWLADRFRVSREQARLLVACGAASGMAAAYNVPIGGALFGLEVLLGSFALELFGPIVVSCVTATVIARVVAGNDPSYVIPDYELMRPAHALLGLGLAPFLALASVLYIRVLGWVEVQLYRVPRGLARFLPPLGMAALGGVALRFPELLGNGYDTVKSALLGDVPLTLLVALPLLKLAASALCAGVGVPGGLFTPSLFYGAMIGGALGQAIQHLAPSIAAPAGAFALMGMAGVLAGTTHAAVSAVLIIFELSGDYGVILPLMLCAVATGSLSRILEPDSLYTAPLRRRGVRLPELPRPDWLQKTPASALLARGTESISAGTPLRTALPRLLALPAGHDLYVLDEAGRYAGVLTLEVLKARLRDERALDGAVASEVMDRGVLPITDAMSLAEVAARFAEADLERLPVVDGEGHLVGTVSKREVLKHGRF